MKTMVSVTCKTCGKVWLKRKTSLKKWNGNCQSCANKQKLLDNPIAKEKFIKSSEHTRFQKGRKVSDSEKEKMKGLLAKEKNPNWKGGPKKCIDCGKELARWNAQRCIKCSGIYRRGRETPLSKRIKMSLNLPRGEKHPNWKGGTTPKRTKQLVSLEHTLWRKAIFERDNYTCQNCGARNGNGKKVILHSHHIIAYSERPDLAYELSNGITLCKECHQKTDNFGNKQANRLNRVSK